MGQYYTRELNKLLQISFLLFPVHKFILAKIHQTKNKLDLFPNILAINK